MHPIATRGAGSPFSFYISLAAGPTSDLVVWTDVVNATSYIVPVARDGSLGGNQTLADTVYVAAAWAGASWSVVAAQGINSPDIFLIELCP